jgi:signal transduction histidine kinase
LRCARVHSKGRALRRRAGGTPLTSLRRALWGLAAAGLILGLIDVALILTSNHIDVRGALAAVALVVGWGFIGTGLFAWDRRPNNSVGSLMVATGFAWLLSLISASNLSVLFTAGSFINSIYFVTAIHMLLAAPYGSGLSRGDRRIVIGGYLLVTVGLLPMFLFVDPARDGCNGCPDNAILIEHNQTVVDVTSGLVSLVGIGLIAAVLVSLIRRWRRATRPERRLYAPVYAAGMALMIAAIAQLGLQTAVSGGGGAAEIAYLISLVPLALVPYLFLASFVRARVAQGGAVGELMARLSAAPRSGQVRDALADALEDPSLELVFWLPDRRVFVDAAGHEYDLPEDDPARDVTKVEREGDCVAAIVHDATLPQMRGHVEAVGAAAALALDNERLDAELRAKIDELRASRERMLRIGLEERRRLERDLHDGAQQRLVSMALNIRLARAKLNEDPLAADGLLARAGDELSSALEELRELARGIQPAVLTDRGLGTALETLASRAPVPVELAELPDERLPEAVELAAYFVVAEALTNVAKYAGATHATVEIARENGRLVVEVADDGVGGANPDDGTGLRGLADRIAVLEGRLEIDSERGRGTTIRARIPCA